METIHVSIMCELDLILWFYFKERDRIHGTVIVGITLVWGVLTLVRVEEFVESSFGEGGRGSLRSFRYLVEIVPLGD